LVAWPSSAVTTEAASRARDMSPARRPAAVMLHTDAAYTHLAGSSLANAATHVSSARRILSAMKAGAARDDRTQTFEARWYAFVASMYTANGQLTQAELLARDGLGLYPRDARLHVARGAVIEMGVTMTSVDQASGNQIARATRQLEAA